MTDLCWPRFYDIDPISKKKKNKTKKSPLLNIWAVSSFPIACTTCKRLAGGKVTNYTVSGGVKLVQSKARVHIIVLIYAALSVARPKDNKVYLLLLPLLWWRDVSLKHY